MSITITTTNTMNTTNNDTTTTNNNDNNNNNDSNNDTSDDDNRKMSSIRQAYPLDWQPGPPNRSEAGRGREVTVTSNYSYQR